MIEKINTDEEVSISLGKPHKTLLFNDEHHSMDEVTLQIIKAIHCDAGRAAQIMMAAHNSGSAVVITAGLEKCELVASILEEIRLGTKVEPA